MKRITQALLLIAITSTLVLSSCKDQKIVKALEGTWNITSWKMNNIEQINAAVSGTYAWTNCKVKKGDCDGTSTVTITGFGTTTSSFTYSIYEKGTKISIDYADASAADITGADILTQTDSEFSFSGTDSDSDAVVVIMTK